MSGFVTRRFLVVTHVPHLVHEGKLYAYGPYVREMNIWLKYVQDFVLVAPLINTTSPSSIDLPYSKNPSKHQVIQAMDFTSVKKIPRSGWAAMKTIFALMKEMSSASHIHLRCPGNVGLLGTLVQIGFPFKKKTAKYAGNWDWRSKEPLSYRLQQYILRSPYLTSNMKVLVYGNWPDKTQNIHPFFTATYHESEKKEVIKTNFSEGLKLIFVGALESYKSPEIVIEVARELKEKNEMFQLYMCGDGSQRESLDLRKNTYMLDQQVLFLGNVNSQRIKELLQSAHFLVFISKSEGWPKAVAEAMFWGCVPITTDVSCVGDMVGRKGERGQLVTPKPDGIADLIIQLKNDPDTFSKMSSEAMNWSRKYTLDYFESEIKKLI